MTETVLVVGLGYVGLPVALRAVDVGFDVIGVETDDERVKVLESGESYVEDVDDAVVVQALATGRFRPVTDARVAGGFDIAVIAVPTPLREGSPDLSHIESAARALAPHVVRGVTVILESTTYPGTTEELVAPILEEGSGLIAGKDFHLGYSPERIDPGNPHYTFVTTPKVVSGVTPESLAAVDAFYSRLVDRTIPVSSPGVAELTKLLENTFRHVNIALVNELAMFAADLDIDAWEAIDAASTKPFGFMPFRPGPGVGGHCLPIDPSYLSWRVRRQLGRAFRFVELANDVNDHMPEYVVRRIVATLNRDGRAVKGSRVLLLGLAYKPNTGDAREAPGLAIADQLFGLEADVCAADPHVDNYIDERVARVDATPEELAAADLVVVVTDHDSFDYDVVRKSASRILDTRHRVAPAPHVEYL